MSIIAERIAVALEGIFKDSVFMKRLLTIGMFAWFCAGCFLLRVLLQRNGQRRPNGSPALDLVQTNPPLRNTPWRSV